LECKFKYLNITSLIIFKMDMGNKSTKKKKEKVIASYSNDVKKDEKVDDNLGIITEIDLSELERSLDSNKSYYISNEFDTDSPDTIDEMKLTCIKKSNSKIITPRNTHTTSSFDGTPPTIIRGKSKNKKASKNLNDRDLSKIISNNSPDNKKKGHINSLDKLVEAIYGAVLKSSATVQRSSLFFLHNYFTYNEENDSFEPKNLRVKLPGTDQAVDIPLFTLVKHTHLEIDRFKVNLNVHLDTSIQKGNRTTDGKYIITTKAVNSDNKSKDLTKIEIEFKRCEPTETISRLVDKYQSLN